jgi:hypothetical protein
MNSMKTKIFFLAILLFVAFSANAQFKKYTFGLKAAPQIAWMKPNVKGYEGNGVKVGFSWGFVSEFAFSENHCISTGFNILFDGGKLKFPVDSNGTIGSINRSYSIKSVEIPLTLKMRTNSIGGIKFYGQIGFGTSFRINAKVEDEYVNGSSRIAIDKTSYDKVSFLRESLIVGLGAEYTLKAGTTLSAGLALNNGFTDMLSGSNGQTKEKATLNFIELNVAVLF